MYFEHQNKCHENHFFSTNTKKKNGSCSLDTDLFTKPKCTFYICGFNYSSFDMRRDSQIYLTRTLALVSNQFIFWNTVHHFPIKIRWVDFVCVPFSMEMSDGNWPLKVGLYSPMSTTSHFSHKQVGKVLFGKDDFNLHSNASVKNN